MPVEVAEFRSCQLIPAVLPVGVSHPVRARANMANTANEANILIFVFITCFPPPFWGWFVLFVFAEH